MAKKKNVEDITPIENAVEVNEEMDNVVELPNEEPATEVPEEESEMKYIDDLGFSVLMNLTSEAIESICGFVNEYRSWTDRFYAKAIATLNLATDLDDNEISELVNQIDMIKNPFIYTVYDNILNWGFVEEALKYYDSISYKVQKIIDDLNEAGKELNPADMINDLSAAVEDKKD